MAYKPYKVNKNNGHNYSRVNKKNDPKYEIARMKLFGFRSGVAWKMIPALLYYVVAIMIIVSSISGEIREFTFEGIDVVLCALKYIFIVVIVFGPAIFWSDFSYRDKLPFLKNRTISGNVIGLVIVYMFSVFMVWTYQYCMSDTYKASADAYYEEKELQKEQLLQEYESSNTE